MGTREDGSFVTVVNNGSGDIYWTDSGKDREVRMVYPDTTGSGDDRLYSPDAMGIADDVLYSTDGEFGLDGKATLWATDLAGDHKFRKAVTWTCPTDSLGDQLSSTASGIFPVGGKLFFLESEYPPDEKRDFPDGSSEKISLAEVDVAKGTHTSTDVTSFPYSMDQVDENDDSTLASAAHEGHLYRGRIHTMAHSGRILAFDTATKKVATIGTVSQAAQKASSAVVTYDGNTMTVLFYSYESLRPAVLETYDLDTGDRTNRIEVDGLVDLIRDDHTGLVVSGVATLHQ